MRLHLLSLALVALFASPGSAFFGKKGKKDGEECRTVYDDVWEEKCKTVYSDSCRTDHVKECQSVNERVCRTVDSQSCSIAFTDKCKELRVPKCSISYETKCHDEQECSTVSDEVCKQVPKSVCHTVTDKQCQTIEEKQCRDVVVSEEVGNFVKVDEKVVATTRHVAEEQAVDHSYHRIADHDESDEAHYREDFDHLAPVRIVEPETGSSGGKKGKGKKNHGIFRRSIRDRINEQRDHLHKRLDALRDSILKKDKKSAPAQTTHYIAEPTVKSFKPTVKTDIQTRTECKSIPTKRCVDVPREKCRQESERVCKQVPKEICQTVEKCNDLPKKECHTETRQACIKVPERQCVTVPEEQCETVPRRACAQVPRQVCTKVPTKDCKKITVSRPREVCDYPVTTVRSGQDENKEKKSKKGTFGF